MNERLIRKLVPWLCFVLLIGAVTLLMNAATSEGLARQSSAAATGSGPTTQYNILTYIKEAWQSLGRSMNECS